MRQHRSQIRIRVQSHTIFILLLFWLFGVSGVSGFSGFSAFLMTVLAGLGLGLSWVVRLVVIVLGLFGLIDNQHLFGGVYGVVVKHHRHDSSSFLVRGLGIVLFSDDDLRYFALVFAFNFVEVQLQAELALESHALLVFVGHVNLALVQHDLVRLINETSVEPEMTQVLLRASVSTSVCLTWG